MVFQRSVRLLFTARPFPTHLAPCCGREKPGKTLTLLYNKQNATPEVCGMWLFSFSAVTFTFYKGHISLRQM